MLRLFLLTVCFLSSLSNVYAQAVDDELVSQSLVSMKRAAKFYREKVASHGGYVYHYSLDLTRRWGEGEATADQIWVQPPGTPTVGLAYISAYNATRDSYYRGAIAEVATALIYGQLKSGRWTNCIDFNPQGERIAQYRHGKGGGKNNSSLDDGQTQTAIQFMIQADRVFEFEHEAIHRSALSALDALLAAQFESGGFPQVWTSPSSKSPNAAPPVKANFPEHDYRTEGRIKNYWDMPTLNDNVCVHVAHTLIEAHRTYQDERYLLALKKLGDFLILAQMPEPQPAWAQQYNYQMQPIWARRFEPPAICGHESQEIIGLLIELAEYTQDPTYLAPVSKGLDYLKRSLLTDGQLARYYELRTNRPLYMKRVGEEYQLTFDDDALPSHYSWKTRSELERLQKEFAAVQAAKPRAGRKSLKSLASQAKTLVQELDDQGRWITSSDGKRLVGQAKLALHEQYISSAAFSQNMTALSDYVWAAKND